MLGDDVDYLAAWIWTTSNLEQSKPVRVDTQWLEALEERAHGRGLC
jgi:hypothetical protein